jgi:hypothetical protein
MSGFGYKTQVDLVVDILQGANTSTSVCPLSEDLTTPINNKNIYNRNPETTVLGGRDLPAIFVRLPSSAEEFEGIGPTGPNKNLKRKTLNIDIIGLYPSQGQTNKEEDRLEEVYNLARNIERVIQTNYNLSGTALWCNPKSTNFTGPYGLEDGTLFKSVLVEVEAQYLFR